MKEGSTGPLAGIEEAGEHSLCEDVRFDANRNNHHLNDFEEVRKATAFAAADRSDREGQFPDPETANLRIAACSLQFLQADTLMARIVDPTNNSLFAGLYRVNADKSMDFLFRDSSVAYLVCFCGKCS